MRRRAEESRAHSVCILCASERQSVKILVGPSIGPSFLKAMGAPKTSWDGPWKACRRPPGVDGGVSGIWEGFPCPSSSSTEWQESRLSYTSAILGSETPRHGNTFATSGRNNTSHPHTFVTLGSEKARLSDTVAAVAPWDTNEMAPLHVCCADCLTCSRFREAKECGFLRICCPRK